MSTATLTVAPEIVRALTRYEIATARYDELDARPASALSPAEFDALQDAQQTVTEAFGVLAEAKRLDLIEPAETAARYRWASLHCRRLAETADFDGCLEAQDEMRACRCRLAAAGRLDLIESVEVRPARNADVERAVVRYEIAKALFDRLSAMDARDMTGHQFTLMAESQDEMAERRTFLESVGQLHRIELA